MTMACLTSYDCTDGVRDVFTFILDDRCREGMTLSRGNGAKPPWLCQGRTSLTGVGDEGLPCYQRSQEPENCHGYRMLRHSVLCFGVKRKSLAELGKK